MDAGRIACVTRHFAGFRSDKEARDVVRETINSTAIA
jgi:hypothetical protein